MKYISIDIESTGLNPEIDQILEFGAVLEDTLNPIPIDRLPTFRAVLKHDRLAGSPGALALNARLITEIAEGTSPDLMQPSNLAVRFANFLHENGFRPDQSHRVEIVVAGKNFGGFDRLFLDRLENWSKRIQVCRRTLDPAILYFDPATDDKPPSLGECLARAGMDPVVKHTAVDDARDVIRLLRPKFADKHIFP